jgi:hypothetical protein
LDEDDDEESQEQNALNKEKKLKAKKLANEVEMNLCMNILLQRQVTGAFASAFQYDVMHFCRFVTWNAFLHTTAAASKTNQNVSNSDNPSARKNTQSFARNARLPAKENGNCRLLNREGYSRRPIWRYGK